jgi:hypothetical protein
MKTLPSRSQPVCEGTQGMNPTFVVYVDESGDEGFSFGGGSSEWFVLSAVVTRKIQDVQMVSLVDRIRGQLGKPPGAPAAF